MLAIDTVAMQLYEQGKFQHTDKVSKYVLEFYSGDILLNNECSPNTAVSMIY